MQPNQTVRQEPDEEWRFLSRSAVAEGGEAETPVSPADLTLINRLAPSELQPDDIYVRSMYLCSDQVCPADWGRFTENALRRICSLVVGRAVLRGHDRSSLPLARFFRAELEERDAETNPETGQPVRWVRAWFYWLRATTGARDLLLNIDGGVYREVSISWRYRSAACSICGDDIRLCEHTPGRTYQGKRCHFVVDEILDVLEGSLVYRGADSEALLAGARAGNAPSTSVRTCETLTALRRQHLLVCLSRLPRSVRSAVASGPVDAGAIRILKSLGLWVRMAGGPGSGPWIADEWVSSDPKPVDLWLVHLGLPGDGSGTAADTMPEGPVGSRYLILHVSDDAPDGKAAERRGRRVLHRLGFLDRLTLTGPRAGTILGEKAKP